MELLSSLVVFINNIMDFKVFNNVSILEILIYLIFVGVVIHFIKIAVKGKK